MTAPPRRSSWPALGSLVPADVEAKIVNAVRPGCRIVLDLSRLEDVSAGGLRLLLMLYREVTAVGGSVSVVGVDREMVGVLDAIGFLGLARRQAARAGMVPRSGTGFRRIDVYPTHRHGDFGLRAGFPIPFGAMASEGGVNVSLYSRHASEVTLVLFEKGEPAPLAEIPFPEEFRIGDVFAMFVFGLDPDRVEYGFRLDGPHNPARFSHIIAPLGLCDANRLTGGNCGFTVTVFALTNATGPSVAYQNTITQGIRKPVHSYDDKSQAVTVRAKDATEVGYKSASSSFNFFASNAWFCCCSARRRFSSAMRDWVVSSRSAEVVCVVPFGMLSASSCLGIAASSSSMFVDPKNRCER